MGHPLLNFHPNRNQVAATDLAVDTSALEACDAGGCDGAAAALELRQLRVRETTERLGMGEVAGINHCDCHLAGLSQDKWFFLIGFHQQK